MMFCQKCGGIIVPKRDRKMLVCAKCGSRTKQKEKLKIKEKVKLGKESSIEVVAKKVDVLPKTKEECPKCQNQEAYHWSVQTRAGDEAETRFFECVKCKHRWRSYS